MDYIKEIGVLHMEVDGSFVAPVIGLFCLFAGLFAFCCFMRSKGSVEETVRALEISITAVGIGCVLIYCFMPKGQYVFDKKNISTEMVFSLADDYELVESTEETITIAPKGFGEKILSYTEAIKWNDTTTESQQE